MSTTPGDQTSRDEHAGRLMQPAHVRAADGDRRRAVAELQEHFVAGRLSSEELGERVEKVLASRTFGELALVLHDLPSIAVPPEDQPEAASPTRDRVTRRQARRERHRERRRHGRYGRRGLRAHATSYFMVMGLLVAIWLLTSPGHYFWPIWPILGWGFGLLAHALSALSHRREELPPAYGAQ
jgi:hypothetical protein